MVGIYKITNNINDKVYIGKSIRIEERIKKHRKADTNMPIHKAIKKYGVEHFTFEILEECNIEELDDREIYWISYYNSKESGYNCTEGGEGASHPVVLSDNDVDSIIWYLSNTDISINEIGKLFNVSSTTISSINCGRSRIRYDINYPVRRSAHKKIEDMINREDLRDTLFKYKGDFEKAASYFNVSSVSLRKLCAKYSLPMYKCNYSNEIKNYCNDGKIDKRIIGKMNTNHQMVDMCNPISHKVLKTFWSIADASKFIGCANESIRKAIHSKNHLFRDYYWEKSNVTTSSTDLVYV